MRPQHFDPLAYELKQAQQAAAIARVEELLQERRCRLLREKVAADAARSGLPRATCGGVLLYLATAAATIIASAYWPWGWAS